MPEIIGRDITRRRKKIAYRARRPVVLTLPPNRLGHVFLHEATSRAVMPEPHRHAEWELNLVTHGWAEYVVLNRRVRITRDSLAWLLPQEDHLLLNQSPDLRMWIAVFRPTLIRRLARDATFAPWRRWLRSGTADQSAQRVLHESVAAGVTGLLQRVSTRAMGPAEHAAAMTTLASEAWRAFIESADTPSGSHLHPGVEKAARWLADHAHEPEADDLDALAARCGLSRPHLSRLFRRQLGVSITHERTRRRVERFQALAGRGGRMSLTQAAYAAGFGSYAQCFRSVRAHTGQSPRETTRRQATPLPQSSASSGPAAEVFHKRWARIRSTPKTKGPECGEHLTCESRRDACASAGPRPKPGPATPAGGSRST
jgi:AraC-like DNA-binding protein